MPMFLTHSTFPRYSFRTPPRLDLNVRPTLGEREVTFTNVTEWIEKKLQCEFQVGPSALLHPQKSVKSKASRHQLSSGFPLPSHQKVFVMPNMDDLYFPLMTSALENPATSQQSSDHFTSKQSSVESQDYLSD